MDVHPEQSGWDMGKRLFQPAKIAVRSRTWAPIAVTVNTAPSNVRMMWFPFCADVKSRRMENPMPLVGIRNRNHCADDCSFCNGIAISGSGEDPGKNRIDMFEMITEVELVLELLGRKIRGHVGVGFE